MGEASMELGERELEKIGKYVQNHLEEWNRNTILSFQSSRDIELIERTVRLEEGLKSSIDLMRQGFDMMDKRFEQVDKRFEQVDKRFEQVDKRFEDMQHNMDKRFEEVNRRFNVLQWAIGIGFTTVTALMAVFKFL
ncbi:MAG: hypothetical protein PQJ61_05415 [Spirochaetales bacterium]|uniref:DUF1640 domain-containing protein n=1 Tax=Candidatus Thalassospirochaeta sargassi TaxID=3119039 RepID=A0AAJ1IE36_9SPIO|nr:hypothetical protein [Spirochaetales bacterium]